MLRHKHENIAPETLQTQYCAQKVARDRLSLKFEESQKLHYEMFLYFQTSGETRRPMKIPRVL